MGNTHNHFSGSVSDGGVVSQSGDLHGGVHLPGPSAGLRPFDEVTDAGQSGDYSLTRFYRRAADTPHSVPARRHQARPLAVDPAAARADHVRQQGMHRPGPPDCRGPLLGSDGHVRVRRPRPHPAPAPGTADPGTAGGGAPEQCANREVNVPLLSPDTLTAADYTTWTVVHKRLLVDQVGSDRARLALTSPDLPDVHTLELHPSQWWHLAQALVSLDAWMTYLRDRLDALVRDLRTSLHPATIRDGE